MVDTDKVIRLSDYVQLERAQKNANGSRFAYDAAKKVVSNVREYFAAHRDGRTYGVRFPLYSFSNSPDGVKVGDNAGLTVVPSTNYRAGRDDYAGLSAFRVFDANVAVADDGTPVVKAIKGLAGNYAKDGSNGDVFVITATVDFDLGHHADARDLTTDLATTWFHDESYDDASAKLLNQELCEKVFNLVKDVQIETTEKTRAFMAATFDNADWAIRDPKVLRGTTVTADNYWKGMHDHANALLMTKTYGCPDPYALTEMEDHAMAVVLDRLGMLDRYIIIRDSVNTDVFMNGASPESLWDPNFVDSLASESSVESADIFATAMKNNFTVGHVVIDAILNGEL